MKQTRGRLIALLAAFALAVSLSACTALGGVTGFDATLYVKGLLNELYLGTFDDEFLRLVDSTKVEAEEFYRGNLDVAYHYFCKQFAVDDGNITADTRDLLCDLVEQLYKNVRFDVHAAVAMEKNEYAVKVTVYPVTVLAQLLEDDYPGAVESFNKLYADMTEAKLNAMGRTEREAFLREYEEAWAGQVAGLLKARASAVTRGDGEVMLVRVYLDADGKYTISDRELALLDELLVAY